jgi:hypothetical protein
VGEISGKKDEALNYQQVWIIFSSSVCIQEKNHFSDMTGKRTYDEKNRNSCKSFNAGLAATYFYYSFF